jgi:hypothetical protein
MCLNVSFVIVTKTLLKPVCGVKLNLTPQTSLLSRVLSILYMYTNCSFSACVCGRRLSSSSSTCARKLSHALYVQQSCSTIYHGDYHVLQSRWTNYAPWCTSSAMVQRKSPYSCQVESWRRVEMQWPYIYTRNREEWSVRYVYR